MPKFQRTYIRCASHAGAENCSMVHHTARHVLQTGQWVLAERYHRLQRG